MINDDLHFGCNYCCGDDPVIYKDNDNCMFIGMTGDVLIVVNGNQMVGNVRFCPMCGIDLKDKTTLSYFLKEVEAAYNSAKSQSFDSIVLAVETDQGIEYRINEYENHTFQCDEFDYVFEELPALAEALFENMTGQVVDIRIE